MHRLVFVLTLLLPLFAACAPTAPKQLRYVWPPSVEDARIEFLATYQSDIDVLYRHQSAVAEALLGIPRPTLLFNQPQAIATADGKKLYVVDSGRQIVRIVDLAKPQLDSLKGEDEQYRFGFPGGIDVVGDDVYVVDTFNRHVVLFRKGFKELVFGVGELERPTGIALDPEHQRIYVVDTGAHRLAVFTFDHHLLKTIGERGSAPGKFNFPIDVDIDAAGNLYVLDSLNARVQVLTPDGEPLRTFGERGTALGSFQVPKALAVNRSSGLVFVTDALAHKFVVFDQEGNFLITIGGKHSVESGTIAVGGFLLPQGVAVDPGGGIFVVDSLNRMIHHFQYLNEAYLRAHPLAQAEVYIPPPPKPPNATPKHKELWQ